jgi:cobalt-precorrin 5A hydrolase
MDLGQAMLTEIAIGIGCSTSARAEDIHALAQEMLRSAPPHGGARIFTLSRKEDYAPLRDAAARLGVKIAFLDEAEFAARQPEFLARGATASAKAQEKTSLASVAEAAALMGAGPRAVLIAPRRAARNVTCALAAPADELTP